MNKKFAFILMFITLFVFTACTMPQPSNKVSVKFIIGDETETKAYALKEVVDYQPEEKEGYEFSGWFIDEELEIKAELEEAYDGLVLYGKYLKKCTITTVIGETNTSYNLLEGDAFNEVASVPGYKFDGWYLDKELTIAFDNCVKEDVTLYPKLSKASAVVTFNPLGGGEVYTREVTLNTNVRKPLNEPFKFEYKFIHWSSEENGEPFDFNTLITNDIELFAVYEKVNYNALMDEYIPSSITESVVLPDEYCGAELYWSSSDPEHFSSRGVYSAPKTKLTITVYLKIMSPDAETEKELTKTVEIMPYQLKDISRGNIVVGYSSSWYYNGYSDVELATLDVVNASFAFVNKDATLDFSQISSTIKSIVPIAHKAGVRVALSIQGYGEQTQNFSDCAADATLRKKLAKSMAQAVVDYNLDGIDIDWEYPGSASRPFTDDRINYTLLMKEIRTELDNLNYADHLLLTAAIPAGNLGSNFDLGALNSVFDYFYMMSYDVQNSNIGSHHTPLYPSKSNATLNGVSIDETVTKWTNAGVDKEKICLGIAFYGKYMRLASDNNNGLGVGYNPGVTPSYKNVKYSSIQSNTKYIGKTFGYYFDEDAHAPYLFSQALYFYTYDNERSVIDKCNYAYNNLGGVMIWEVGEDPTGLLIASVNQGMHLEHLGDYVVSGKRTFNVNDSFKVKVVNEIYDSILNSDVEYLASDASAIIIDGQNVTVKTSGTYTITARNKVTNEVYGTLTLEVKGNA